MPAAPRGNVECKTVREILPPWHVLQEKLQKKSAAASAVVAPEADQAAREALAAQEAANAMWRPASDDAAEAPHSGVRMSEPGQVHATPADFARPATAQSEDEAAAAVLTVPPVDDSLLSFKVYTLAELERRSDAPVSVRASRANLDAMAARPSHWEMLVRVGVALRAFAIASRDWVKIKGERPNVKVALRQPFDNLGDELQRAVEGVDWKRLGVTTGIVVGATLTLLFAVLTAAELTDDLKPPGSAAHLASTETSSAPPAKSPLDPRGVAPATNMAAMGVQPVGAAPVAPHALLAPVAVAPEAPVTQIGDIDAPEEAPAPPAAKRPAPRKAAAAAAPAKPKTSKLTFRNADAVFHP